MRYSRGEKGESEEAPVNLARLEQVRAIEKTPHTILTPRPPGENLEERGNVEGAVASQCQKGAH